MLGPGKKRWLTPAMSMYISAGWLASRMGGRRVWGWMMFVSALCTLLTPVAARTHVYLAYAVRIVLGFAAVSRKL